MFHNFFNPIFNYKQFKAKHIYKYKNVAIFEVEINKIQYFITKL